MRNSQYTGDNEICHRSVIITTGRIQIDIFTSLITEFPIAFVWISEINDLILTNDSDIITYHNII
jgi:hypothetical protein